MGTDERPGQTGDWNVLVAEDHEPTARLVDLVFEEIDPSIETYVVGDGKECLEMLSGETDEDLPDLLVLDIEMPEVDGIHVLEACRADPDLEDIPTVVVSRKDDPETIEECYEKGADAFVSKPDDYEGYLSITEDIVNFWLTR